MSVRGLYLPVGVEMRREDERLDELSTFEVVAHHEAGHVVQAYANGSEITRLAVFRDIETGRWGGAARANPVHGRMDWVVERYLAGNAASFKYLGEVAPFPDFRPLVPGKPDSDQAKAWETARIVQDETPAIDPDAWMRDRYEAALRFIHSDEAWKIVCALACNLMTVGPSDTEITLTGGMSVEGPAVVLTGEETVKLIEDVGFAQRSAT